MRKSFLALLLVGCATAPPLAPTVPIDRRVEEEVLPPDPETEPLDSKLGSADWIEPLESGSCHDAVGKLLVRPCPVRSGIAMSEAKAARFGLYKLRYRQLRTNYEANMKVVGVQRELYETRLKQADKAIRDLQPSWLDQHSTELGILGGFALGVATVYAARAANK
jgi:hypothetical protein